MKIIGARVYGASGAATRDIHIAGERIVSDGGAQTLDATGLAALAGAIDIHSHPLAFARLAALSGGQAGWDDFALSARNYLSLGYTFFVEAGLDAAPADENRMAFAWLHLARKGERLAPGALAGKFIGETGIEAFFAAPEWAVAHHLHLPHLAKGESFAALESFLKRLDGRRCHLSHVSHYAFESKNGRLLAAGQKAARLLAKHPNVTFDCGPVVFGPAVAFTVDAGLAERVSKSGGGGLVRHAKSPYTAAPYTFDKLRYVDALLWLNAMELMLSAEDISHMALSIDFPSGGGIAGYPHIIECLMNRDARNDFIRALNADAVVASSLNAIGRELTPGEIVALTRETPARACGLAERGHLGIGAVADVVLYEEGKFGKPRTVIQNGRMIVENGTWK